MALNCAQKPRIKLHTTFNLIFFIAFSHYKLWSESRSALSHTHRQYVLTATFTNLLYLHSQVLHEHNVSLLFDLNFFGFLLCFLLGFSDNTDGYSIQFEMHFAPFVTLLRFLKNCVPSQPEHDLTHKKKPKCSHGYDTAHHSIYNLINIQQFHAIDLHD